MSGYIGPIPVPQGIQNKETFTATAGQTTFNTNGYTDGAFISVYLNGVRLINGTDYTATNGSDVVLTTAASASDVVDFETFNSFSLASQQFENITTKNPTHEDTDGGRESAISFKGEQSGGEISTLAQIQASHDGTSDDQKGDLIFKTNDGSDNDAPTERLRINSAGDMLFSSEDPSLTIANTTHEDTDGGRESTIVFQGEQSGGEVSTLAQIEAAHDGTADDEKGKLIFRVNDGNDGASPTLSTEITSDGGVHIKNAGNQTPLIVENTLANGNGSYINLRDGNSTSGVSTWIGRSSNDTYIYGTNTALAIKITGGSSNPGIVTMPSQPCFNTSLSSNQSNIAINSIVTILFASERFDVGSNFSSNTFTAPVTGKYQLNVELRLDSVDTAATYYHIYLVTSNKTYHSIMDPNFSSDLAYHSMSLAVLADMDANDTVSVGLYQANGTAQTDISQDSIFSGILVA